MTTQNTPNFHTPQTQGHPKIQHESGVQLNGNLSQQIPSEFLEPLEPGEVELPLNDGVPDAFMNARPVMPQSQTVGRTMPSYTDAPSYQVPQTAVNPNPQQVQQMPQPVQQSVQQQVPQPVPVVQEVPSYVYENSIPEEAANNIENLEEAGGDISVLFPEQITMDVINNWKSVYKEVYAVNILDRVWFIRPIIRNEYIAIMANAQDRYTTEEQIAAVSVIWPKFQTLEARQDGAGIATSLSDFILRMSGFSSPAVPFKL